MILWHIDPCQRLRVSGTVIAFVLGRRHMMRIAIPLFKDRVAPNFGSSSRVLLVEISNGTVKQEAKWDVGGAGAMDMAHHLVNLGVEKVICGGISKLHKQWLTDKGIIVEDNQKGEAAEIIKKLLSGKKN